jgi:hypothetical protein
VVRGGKRLSCSVAHNHFRALQLQRKLPQFTADA